MSIFGPKKWVNPFGKKVNFSTFRTSSFYSLEKPFFVLEYRKRHFPGSYCLKKKLEKWPILDENYGLTPLEKCHFFDVLNFLFLWPKKAFFCSRISQKTFSWHILPQKKKLEKGPSFEQNHGLTPLGKCQFFDFLKFLFLSRKKAFFLF